MLCLNRRLEEKIRKLIGEAKLFEANAERFTKEAEKMKAKAEGLRLEVKKLYEQLVENDN